MEKKFSFETTIKFNASPLKIASLLPEYPNLSSKLHISRIQIKLAYSICYATLFRTYIYKCTFLPPDLQVDEVLADDGLPLGGAGLVEGPRLLLRPGHVLRGGPAQDRADDVLVPLVYRLK